MTLLCLGLVVKIRLKMENSEDHGYETISQDWMKNVACSEQGCPESVHDCEPSPISVSFFLFYFFPFPSYLFPSRSRLSPKVIRQCLSPIQNLHILVLNATLIL